MKYLRLTVNFILGIIALVGLITLAIGVGLLAGAVRIAESMEE